MLIEHDARLDHTDYFDWNPLAFLERMILKNHVKEDEDYTDMLRLLGQESSSVEAND